MTVKLTMEKFQDSLKFRKDVGNFLDYCKNRHGYLFVSRDNIDEKYVHPIDVSFDELVNEYYYECLK